MNAGARSNTGLFAAIGERLAAYRAARAQAKANRAAQRVFKHVATIRGTVYEYNPVFCYDDTYQGHAFLLEDGRGKRTVDASCRAIYRSTPVRAFLKGMSLRDVEGMRGELGYTPIVPAPWSREE